MSNAVLQLQVASGLHVERRRHDLCYLVIFDASADEEDVGTSRGCFPQREDQVEEYIVGDDDERHEEEDGG